MTNSLPKMQNTVVGLALNGTPTPVNKQFSYAVHFLQIEKHSSRFSITKKSRGTRGMFPVGTSTYQ